MAPVLNRSGAGSMAVQPVGTVAIAGVLSAVIWAIIRSPAASPEGRPIGTDDTAVVEMTVVEAPAVTEPLPVAGGATTIVCTGEVLAPTALAAVRVTG